MTATLGRQDLLDRRLPLPGTFNLREVRDYATADGRRVRAGRLYRSDALHRLDQAGRRALRERGLRTVIDLRQRGEREAAPDALEGVGARLLAHPLLERAEGLREQPAPIADLPSLYATVIAERGFAVAAAIGELARPGALPALVHCTAGKDRTGILIALLLSALGVDEGTVAADFSVSELCLDDEFRRGFLERSQEQAVTQGVTPAVLASLLGSDPSLAHQVLAQVSASDGSAAAYLVRNGLPAADLAVLAEALLTPTIPIPGGDMA